MPVHDWTRVDDGIFHSFHTTWIGELTKVLNAGLLPPECYALGEQVAGGIGPDVLTLQELPNPEGNGRPQESQEVQGAVAVATAPPQVRLTMHAGESVYLGKQRTIVIRHASGHRIIAVLEILSAGNKSSQHAVQAFLDKSLAALDQGIHLLLIDLYPPGPRDPRGMHGLLWENLTGKVYEQPADKPLTLAGYAAGQVKTAYVEPVAVGDVLKDMPLFLTPEQYVNVPLESTYQAAYSGVPRFYRNQLEG